MENKKEKDLAIYQLGVLEESLKLFKSLVNIKLKKQKQWDFFLCKEVWVYKIVFENTIIHVSEENFEQLKELGFECITID